MTNEKEKEKEKEKEAPAPAPVLAPGDKGTPVLTTREQLPLQEGASVEVIRGARPTGADTPIPPMPPAEPESKDKDKDKDKEKRKPRRPEEAFLAQTEKFEKAQKAQKKAHKAAPEEQVAEFEPLEKNPAAAPGEQRVMSGLADGACTGARTGNPMLMMAENLLGDKVFDVHHDGSFTPKIQNRDKSSAFALDDSEPEDDKDLTQEIKRKVQLNLPSVNSKVAQKRLLIYIGQDSDCCEMFLVVDVPTIEILVPLDELIHVELFHVDQEGFETAPYMVDFYTDNRLGLHPLEAAPIGVEMLENVTVNVHKQKAEARDKKKAEAKAKKETAKK